MNSFATFHIVSLCVVFLCTNEFVSEYIFGSHFNLLMRLSIYIVESKHLPRINACQSLSTTLCWLVCVKSKHLLKVGVHKVCLQFFDNCASSLFVSSLCVFNLFVWIYLRWICLSPFVWVSQLGFIYLGLSIYIVNWVYMHYESSLSIMSWIYLYVYIVNLICSYVYIVSLWVCLHLKVKVVSHFISGLNLSKCKFNFFLKLGTILWVVFLSCWTLV
jgi:hypothetical protein